MQTTSNCTITLSHECKEGKDQVPGKRLFVVDEVLPEDQVFWDQKAEEEPAKWRTGRKALLGRGNKQHVWKWSAWRAWGAQAGQWDQGGMRGVMFTGRVDRSQVTLGLTDQVKKLRFYRKCGRSYARALLENDMVQLHFFKGYASCWVDAGLEEDRSGSSQLGSCSVLERTQ